MTFARRGPGGGDWGVGAKLTAAQINGIDTDHANAVDKTGDTVASVITFNAAGAITIGASGTILLSSRTLTRASPFPPSVDDFTKWKGTAPGFNTTLVNTTQHCFFQLRMPNGVTWNTGTVQVIAAGGHAGLPGTMPSLRASKFDQSTATTTPLVTVSDSSANTGAFQAQHTIQVTGIATVIDNTQFVYWLDLATESGANALAGFQAYGVVVTYTTTVMDFD